MTRRDRRRRLFGIGWAGRFCRAGVGSNGLRSGAALLFVPAADRNAASRHFAARRKLSRGGDAS